jgi:S-adenosylmethionine hydrolase
MQKKFIVLLTDFGVDFAVGSLKALLLSSFPNAQVLDLDHSIEKFSVISAAFVLNKTYKYFPSGSLFICVVDPGVGTSRKMIYVEREGYGFLAPNNGLLHYILKDNNFESAHAINEQIIAPKSITFHGRDLLVPAAIKLLKNQRDFLEKINVNDLILLNELDNDVLVTYIDSFGNIKTNCNIELIKRALNSDGTFGLRVRDKLFKIKLASTFDDVQKGELLGYEGSNETLEIAINQGCAKEILEVKVGDKLII